MNSSGNSGNNPFGSGSGSGKPLFGTSIFSQAVQQAQQQQPQQQQQQQQQQKSTSIFGSLAQNGANATPTFTFGSFSDSKASGTPGKLAFGSFDSHTQPTQAPTSIFSAPQAPTATSAFQNTSIFGGSVASSTLISTAAVNSGSAFGSSFNTVASSNTNLPKSLPPFPSSNNNNNNYNNSANQSGGGAFKVADQDKSAKFAGTVNGAPSQDSVMAIRDRMKKARDDRETEYYKNYKQMSLTDAKSIRGTCRHMCPEFERYDREVTQELHLFESLKGTEKDAVPKADHELAVKKYRRSAAGKDPEIFPEDIRPPEVLLSTMNYLMDKILTRTDQEYLEVYNFVRDRVRAIRKDFKIQNHLKGPECVSCLERTVRFLIHSDFILCELPEVRYSWSQNRHQLVDTLTTLMHVYDEELLVNIRYDNEAEFRAYYILLMLDDNTSIDELQTWRFEILSQSIVQESLQIHRLYQNRLSEPLIRRIQKSRDLHYFHVCIIHSVISKIRSDGLKTILAALNVKEKVLPLEKFRRLFAFDGDQDALVFAREFGSSETIADDSSTGSAALLKFERELPETNPKFTVKKNEFALMRQPKGSAVEIISGREGLQQSNAQLLDVYEARRKKEQEERLQREKEEQGKVRRERDKIKAAEAKELFGKIIEGCVKDVTVQMAQDILALQGMKKKLIAVLANEVIRDSVKYLTSSIALQLLNHRQLSNQAASDQFRAVIKEIVGEQLNSIAAECLADRRRELTSERRFLQAWRSERQQREHERKRLRELENKKRENIRCIPTLPSSVIEFNEMSKDQLPVNALAELSLVTSFDATLLADELIQYVKYLKICVSSHQAKTPEHLAIDHWLSEQFRGQSTQSDIESSGDYILKHLYADCLLNESNMDESNADDNNDDATCKVLIVNELTVLKQQSLHGSTSSPSNSSSPIPGTNLLLFQAIFDFDKISLPDIRESLRSFLTFAPAQSSPYVLIAYWANYEMPENEIIQILSIKTLLSTFPNFRFRFKQLGNISTIVNRGDAKKRLSDAILDIVHIIELPVRLVGLFDEYPVPDMMDEFFSYSERMSKSFAELISLDIGKVSVHYLELMKRLMVRIQHMLKSEHLSTISWPFDPRELPAIIVPRLDWNSEQTLSSQESIVKKFTDSLVFPASVRSMEDLRSMLETILRAVGSNAKIILSPTNINSSGRNGIVLSIVSEFFQDIWKQFLHLYIERLSMSFKSTPITTDSLADMALTSWRYELARASFTSSIRKRTINSTQDYLELSRAKRLAI